MTFLQTSFCGFAPVLGVVCVWMRRNIYLIPLKNKAVTEQNVEKVKVYEYFLNVL